MQFSPKCGLLWQAQERDWRGEFQILIGSRDDIEGDYSELLASSTFCLMAPGVQPGICAAWQFCSRSCAQFHGHHNQCSLRLNLPPCDGVMCTL